MFKYVTDVSAIAQHIIKNYCSNFHTAIDATLGNGHDADFLSELFCKVYAFDIQQYAVKAYEDKKKKNVVVINDSHHKFKEYIEGSVDCIMYNLGYMPGGDKSITTKCHTTIESIKFALEILNSGGIITICIYVGHEEGNNEKNLILDILRTLPTNKYAVMLHSFYNRKNNPPLLVVIEKK
jgi:hypothetical protein